MDFITFNQLTSQDVWRLVFVVAMLIISALVSGSETAFFSLTPQSINRFKEERSKWNDAVLRLLSMQNYLLATILIVNNLVNICIVIVSNAIIDSVMVFSSEGAEFGVKMVMVTFLLLLFGEIMPKIFASYNGEKFAKFTAIPLLFLKSLFKPLSYLLIKSSHHINESLAKKRINISIDQLSNAIEITSDQTIEEKKMLSGIVNFVSTEVTEIMKPRIDMVAVDVDEDFAKVREIVISSGFSRIPVYEESLDNIKGVLYVKDMLPYITGSDDFEWQNLMRKPYFIPQHKKINDLLEEFQNNKVHLAIVVDEYGSTQGLVSLEDILEEIVGEISDESDGDESFYTKVSADTYIFEGKTHINDLLKVLSLEDDYLDSVKGDAETVAGLMLEVRRDFLKQGDKVTARNLTLSVEKLDVRRIDKVKVVVG